MIKAVAGTTLKEQKDVLDDRLMKLNNDYNPDTWTSIRRLIDSVEPLEIFKDSVEQNTKHRYKYPTGKKLINKLSGAHKQKSGKRGPAKVRTKFIRAKFPEAFKFTWAMVLNKANWTSLTNNPKKKKQLQSTSRKLVLKFTGGRIPDWLVKKKLDDRTLKYPEFVRLKKLFNSIAEHLKSEKSTRELDHIVTNMLACLLSGNDDPTSKRGLADFKAEG